MTACGQPLINSADREVASLIQKRQQAALGFNTNANLAPESGSVTSRSQMYSLVPSPVDPAVPEGFRRATAVREPVSDGETPENLRNDDPETDASPPDALAEAPQPFTLSDALAYAARHARRYQTEKEILYLSALDLTLERYLWTPRFVDSMLSFDYDEARGTDTDQAFSAVANFAVEQRLPYGGEVTARVISNLARDIGENVATGESGQIVLQGRLPLLRGAGPPAYEGRYRAERELVYSVRSFERFRREFMVALAGDFFNLLSQKAQIESAQMSAASLERAYRREKALADAERKLPLDADRARVGMLTARDSAQITRQNYETALDFFKIRLGMPTQENIDVVDDGLDLYDPEVSVAEATEAALKYRLDLATARDQIDDARRAVDTARNNILPQVDLRASMTSDTDATRLSAGAFDSENTRWSAGVDVEIPLDRKRERNDYRGALIALRRIERDYEESVDNVRLEVRRALRRIVSAYSTMGIQNQQIQTNIFRADMVQAKLDAGQDVSIFDVVDAQEDLAQARNSYAASRSDFRRAVLEFLRDSGTLRVDDEGKWARYDDRAEQESGP